MSLGVGCGLLAVVVGIRRIIFRTLVETISIEDHIGIYADKAVKAHSHRGQTVLTVGHFCAAGAVVIDGDGQVSHRAVQDAD